MNILDTINSKWKDKKEQGDIWQVKPLDDLEGDCEDYVFTVLYHVFCDSKLRYFLMSIIKRDVEFWHIEALTGNGNERSGHMVMESQGLCIDNWEKAFITQSAMEFKHGHEFKYKCSRISVLYNLLRGKLGNAPAFFAVWGFLLFWALVGYKVISYLY